MPFINENMSCKTCSGTVLSKHSLYCPDCKYARQLNAQEEWNKSHKNSRKEQAHKYLRTYNGKWTKFRATAKNREIKVDITKNEFVELNKGKCEYCDGFLDTDVGTGSRIDRINSALGYVKGNVCTACGTCNKIKGEHFTPEETKIMVRALIEYKKCKGVENNAKL